MSGAYDDAQVVGIDLHRRRTVVVRKSARTGELVGEPVRINNDPDRLVAAVAPAGPGARVVIEATYGWYWAVDALQAAGCEVHMAHPLANAGFRNRRVKNDVADASDLADLLRLNRLAESWIAPPELRERRELVRHRHRLVEQRTRFKNQVHGVLAKCGRTAGLADVFAPTGPAVLTGLGLPGAYADRIESLRRLVDDLDAEIDAYDGRIAASMAGDAGYQAVQTIPGVGPVLAAVFVVEIGDIARFARPAQLCCWAGLTPRHYESDTTVHRGNISKQGSKLVRWAAVEAVQRQRQANPLTATRERVAASRGSRNLGKVAAARKMLTYVYYGLRDHHIRALAAAAP